PALADLERELDEEGKYQEFQDTFLKVTGKAWLETRHKFKIMRGRVEKTLVEMGYMSAEDAGLWVKESSTQGYQIAIEDFAERVKSYVERTGKRVVFLVDEIGQFISQDSQLMLNLQTITEELGVRCKGKVWVIVTAQEDIDSMTENMQERSNDFSKIQGRFKTRLSLSSVNADEVIRERILKKNDTGKSTLKALYETQETTIQNVVDFKGAAIEMKKIKNAEEFANVYPFLPYQFNLLADVLNAIRLNSSTGKHLSEGERSMLGAYQKAAIFVMEQEEGVLVPFYRFYDDLIKFLDHTHAGVIQRAYDNERLNPMHDEDCFTINVLKTLFLLK
ncbi:BREX system P-loop protein BrxC, partial [Blautia pseudococcoides]|nr:BREX system P-loop protein BrxC [Blautia pseudococcoides]